MKKTGTLPVETDPSYDSDFYEWTQRVAEDLRQSGVSQTDRQHVADEIEDLGKRDKREVLSRLTVLLAHLLKWALQPECRRGSTWLATINEQRDQLTDIFEQSPSLRRYAQGQMQKAGTRAVRSVCAETGIVMAPPATSSPVPLEKVMDPDYLPEDPARLFD